MGYLRWNHSIKCFILGMYIFSPKKSIWNAKAHIKVAFFTWTTALGKIPTLDNLHHVTIWCQMCKKNRETGDHLLLHYEYARELWSPVFCLFRVQWIMLHRVLDLLACWKRGFAKHGMVDIWNSVRLCLMWTIWREHNKALEGLERTTTKLKLILLWVLFD